MSHILHLNISKCCSQHQHRTISLGCTKSAANDVLKPFDHILWLKPRDQLQRSNSFHKISEQHFSFSKFNIANFALQASAWIKIFRCFFLPSCNEIFSTFFQNENKTLCLKYVLWQWCVWVWLCLMLAQWLVWPKLDLLSSQSQARPRQSCAAIFYTAEHSCSASLIQW